MFGAGAEVANLGGAIGTIPLSDMDLRLFRIFKTIVESKGLKPAQSLLGIGLPSISKHLSDLEIRLGTRLCHRGRQKFELTEQGEFIYRAMSELFESLETFQSKVSDMACSKIKELRMGIVDNTIFDPSSPIVGTLEAINGLNLRVTLSVHDPKNIEQAVSDGRLDVGIIPIYVRQPSLEYQFIYDESVRLYCGMKHPLFKKLGSSFDVSMIDYKIVNHGYVDKSVLPKAVLSSMSDATAWQVEAVAMLVMSGRFLGYLPEHYAESFVKIGRLKDVSGVNGYFNQIAAVFRRSSQDSHLLTRVLSALKGVTSPTLSLAS